MKSETFLSSLTDNPYFNAGFGLLGVGSLMALGRTGGKQAFQYAKRNMLITMEIPSRDKSFPWFMEWMASREGSRTRHVSVETNFHQFENGEIKTQIQLTPSPGVHFITYKGHLIRVERTREKNVVDFSSGSLWETVQLTTLGKSRRVFEDLLDEAKLLALKKEDAKTVIYTSGGGDWRRFGFPRKKRPLSSVILDQNKADFLLKDVREFLTSGQWYIERGIPYRRGYLLHGPPGSGKSSFITALAGELNLNICILNLNSRGISDDVLNHLLNIAPQRSIILLEDIDAAVSKNAPSSVTHSGLLNALDGVAATEGGGRIIFMTTNHLHRLPPALIRPGRVDVKEYLGYATYHQLQEMFLKFFPGEANLASQFAKEAEVYSPSMAQIQSFLLHYKQNPSLALRESEKLKRHPKEEEETLEEDVSYH